MTTLAILADIHGNLPALEAVLEDLQQFEVDQVIVAGDVINWGPFNVEVMERVTRQPWAVLRGNNEFYLLDHRTPRAPEIWKTYTLMDWLHEQLHGRWQNIIAAWPDYLSLRYPDAPPVRVCHGTPLSPWKPLSHLAPESTLAESLVGVEESTVIAAHTHIAMDRRVERWHVLNPGSVGVPLDGKISASYMLLHGDEQGWRPTFRRVPFDLAPLFREFERQGFVERGGPAGEVTARLVIEEFRTARLHLLPFRDWHTATCPDEPMTIELLDRFTEADRDAYTIPEYKFD